MIFYVSRARDDDSKPCEGAQRDGDDWIIELEDLNALLALGEREGHRLVVSPKANLIYPWITIYDDYME